MSVNGRAKDARTRRHFFSLCRWTNDFYVFGKAAAIWQKKDDCGFIAVVLETIFSGMCRDNSQAVPTIGELNWLAASAHSLGGASLRARRYSLLYRKK